MDPDLWHSGLYRLRPGLAWGWILSQDLQALGRAFDVFDFQPLSCRSYFGRNRQKGLSQAPDTVEAEGLPRTDSDHKLLLLDHSPAA